MSQFVCDTETGCTITVQVEPAPPSAERVDDLLSLFYAFMAVLAVLWCARQFINLFSGDTEK